MATLLRRDLEDNTASASTLAWIPGSTPGRRAVHVAALVKRDVTAWISAVDAAREVVKRGKRPTAAGRSQLKNGARVIGPVAVGRAIEVAGTVESEAGDRSPGELSARAGEAVEQVNGPA